MEGEPKATAEAQQATAANPSATATASKLAKKQAVREQRARAKVARRAACVHTLERVTRLFHLDDYSKPSFGTSGLPIIIAMDLEFWERDSNLITEIGIAQLDMDSVQDFKLGDMDSWSSNILCRHIVPQYGTEYRNGRWVMDARDYFEHGTTEKHGARWIKVLLDRIFAPPYDTTFTTYEPCTQTTNLRPVYLVCHSPANDIAALNRIGWDHRLFVTDIFDTASISEAYYDTDRQVKLSDLAATFRFDPEHYHNAGNDAFVTLRLAAAIANGHRKGLKGKLYEEPANADDEDDDGGVLLYRG